ncbi:MAG: 2-polyprenylphenol 6-hydroxylase [Rickettsiales bacterium]|nr:2-polyprenylphenol 6-hydroxylase [Rickettsiales bacterium]
MMFNHIRNTKRLFTIAHIMAREDALFVLEEFKVSPVILALVRLIGRKHPEKRKGQRLASAFEKLGPAFIKLGQILSTRSDLIGERLADDLSSLRDALPPFPTAIAKAIIEEEMGQPLEQVFDLFSETAVAAASIAQVHKAQLKTGEVVAVKILRPDVEKAFERDLDVFFWLATIMERRLPHLRRLKPLEVVRTLKESVFLELDLRFEAAAATEFAQNLLQHESGLRVPKVYWMQTSRRLFTMEWINGIPLNDVAAIKASGVDVNMLLAKSANSLFAQVFRDGFFHADLHPGNLFVDAKGDLVAVDFGIMGRLDWKSRMYIAEILRGFLTEDYRHVAEVHFTAGYVPAHKSIEAFTQACMAVAKPITGKPLNEISVARLLGQMFKIAAEFEMETQPQLLLMQKTMMVAEGVGRMLNPQLNIWELARPMIEDWAQEQFGLKGKARDTLQQGADIVKKLPTVLGHIEQALELFSDPRGIRLHPHTLLALQERRDYHHKSWVFFAWSALAVVAAIGIAIAS